MCRASPAADIHLTAVLSAFSALVLDRKTPQSIHPVFDAHSIALSNRTGVIIQNLLVSCTLHHLATKIAGLSAREEMAELLAPLQLGYRIKGSIEAIVHAAQCFLLNLLHNHAVGKLDSRGSRICLL